MRATFLSVLAAGLLAACGLDTAGELPSDAAGGGLEGGPLRDAGPPKDGTLSADARQESGGSQRDAPLESSGPFDAGSDAGPHDGGTGDGDHDGGASHDASAHDGGHDAGHDGAAHEAGGHDAADHDAGDHDAGAHDAEAHDAAEDVVITQPPGNCGLFGYSCGSASCNCSQTCAVNECGPCIAHYTTCSPITGTCGTDLSSVLSCGSCGNICTCDPLTSYPTCSPSGSTYVCGCQPY